jgi:signal transduction histidine kinase/HD-GYP domain-containing protein (c-di-GMP phosphodiesterase class II)
LSGRDSVFRSGAEIMFTGDGGAVAYLFLVLLLSIASIGRASMLDRYRNGGAMGGIAAGFFLFAASRVLHVLFPGAVHAGYSAAAMGAGLAGIYLLMSGTASGRRETDYSPWNAGLAVPAAVSGIVAGAVMLVVAGGKPPDSAMMRFAYHFAAFAPAGLVAGLVLGRKRIGPGKEGFIFASAALLAVSSAMAGLISAGLTGKDSFWIQLFALVDVAGIFLFLMAVLFESPAPPVREDAVCRETAPGALPDEMSLGGRNPGRKMVEISMRIIGGEKEQAVYKALADAIYEETQAGFVLIRTAGEIDERFEPKVWMHNGVISQQPHFSMKLSKSRFTALCSEGAAAGCGYLLDRDTLAEDSDAFVPEGVEWNANGIVVVPVREDGMIRGFFTAGFFKAAPPPGLMDVLRMYSFNVIEICAREELKEKARSARKALSSCKEELESANQLKSNFLSIVSHELRTPLTSIKAYAETLLDNIRTIERETIRNFLMVMSDENDRVIKLVDNMLSYSSMETGHLKVEKSACNLGAMITASLKELEKSFIDKKVNTDVRLPRNEVVIDADTELIRQLLNNLISNAVKFTPQMGKVTISLEEEASAARIVVQDTGKGIPEDQLEMIFERFHQVDASDTREFGGSGLGLAICKNIVEWHDGRIWVENVKEAGAKFVVMLPAKDIIVRQTSGPGHIGSVRFERERYLSLLVEMISEFLQAKKASIMVLNREKNVLQVLAAKGLDPEFVQNTNVELGERIAGKVFLEGESIHVFDIEKDGIIGRVNNSAYYGTNSFISSPLREDEKIIGVINVSDHVEGREFTKADMEVLEAFSGIAAGMLKKLEAFETVSSNFEGLKEAMKSILHIREGRGSRNLVNYSLVALAVGRRLGLAEDSLTALRMGMNVYDLGMMKIPRSIRVKKEELADRERKKLHEHANLGYKLLSPMGLDEKIMKMVRYHHEFFDGSGYPEGLVRDEIPIEARIINVVDSFRALISHGPYRRAFTIDEARNEIIRNSGTKFDPRVVGAFVKVLHEMGARDNDHELVLDSVERELDEIRENNEIRTSVGKNMEDIV